MMMNMTSKKKEMMIINMTSKKRDNGDEYDVKKRIEIRFNHMRNDDLYDVKKKR